jgi:hypothetical protein
MKDVNASFKAKMRLQQEPYDELKLIRNILRESSENQDGLNADDPSKRAYFFKEFIPGLAKTLAQVIKIKVNNHEFTELIRQVMPLLAVNLAANLDNLDLLEGTKCIFDHKSRLYQYHALSEENAILLVNSFDRLSVEEREWRQTVQVGAQLDAIKVDPDSKVKCWAKCTVSLMVAESRIKVTFENESHHCDRELSLYSLEIAKAGSKAEKDTEWRESLQVEDRVDCYDSTGYWYASTIAGLETREFQGSTIKMAHIAFRVSHPEGDKTDAAGNRYFGWDDKFDEWLPLYCARLQRY